MKKIKNEINLFRITGDWKTQAEALKQQFSNLNDTQLEFKTGKEDELLSRLGEALNKRRNHVINLIKAGQTK